MQFLRYWRRLAALKIVSPETSLSQASRYPRRAASPQQVLRRNTGKERPRWRRSGYPRPWSRPASNIASRRSPCRVKINGWGARLRTTQVPQRGSCACPGRQLSRSRIDGGRRIWALQRATARPNTASSTAPPTVTTPRSNQQSVMPHRDAVKQSRGLHGPFIFISAYRAGNTRRCPHDQRRQQGLRKAALAIRRAR